MTMLLPNYTELREALERVQQRRHDAACERRRTENRPWRPEEMDVETLARELSDA